DRTETQRDLVLRPDRTQRVDLVDLSAAFRHDAARLLVADLEDREEPHRDRHAEREVAPARPDALGLAARERGCTERDPRRRHAVPEPSARTAERAGEVRVREEEAREGAEGSQRTNVAARIPRTRSAPNAACSCAVWMSIIAIARC